jgi:hypothetical protein
MPTPALSLGEATRRLAAHGPNQLVAVLSQFNNVLIYVLIGSALITALLQHWVDTGVILAVVIVNAVIGFIQEGPRRTGDGRRSAGCWPRDRRCCATGGGSASMRPIWCPATSC